MPMLKEDFLKKIVLCCSLFFFWINSYSQTALTVNAGSNTGFCLGNSITIGGTPSASGGVQPYTYLWQPVSALNAVNLSNPNASPTTSTDYTLTVTDSTGAKVSDVITVTVLPLPAVSAGVDQTILSGGSTSLNGTGAVNYFWTPTAPLTNQNSANPAATPIETTTFCVTGTDANQCANYDCVTIEVLPSDELIFYNSFTPNSDGINDLFYIGNIEFYPNNVLEVFNRNGKMVYRAAPYQNKWNGEIDGHGLPCATYYYVLDPGRGKPIKRGGLTIIR